MKKLDFNLYLIMLLLAVIMSNILFFNCSKKSPSDPNKTDEQKKGWVIKDSGTSNSLTDVFFLNSNIGWAVAGRHILRTTDGGNSWTRSPETGDCSLMSIFFTDAKSGYAVGSYTASSSAVVLKTTNGGKNWQKKFLRTEPATYARFDYVHFVNKNTGWIFGGNGDWDGFIYKTQDGGNSWKLQFIHINMGFNDGQFVDTNTGFALTSKSLIVKTSDGGNIWRVNNLPEIRESYGATNYFGFSLYFLNPNIGWVVGAGDGIIKTTDGGVKWNIINHDNFHVNLLDIQFVDQNTGWAVGTYGKIIKTNDGGNSWVRQESGISHTLNAVFFLDSNIGCAVGHEGTILKTTSGG